MKKLLCILVTGLAVSSVFAGGYRVSTQGQRALAMGHTGVAVVNSAELAFFNPAGLVFLESKLNISAGVTGIASNVKYQNLNTRESSETDSGISTPFNLYASYAVTDWLSVALAVYTPFGSSVVWETNWAGADLVNEINLQSIFINPTIAVKVHENFSIGGGPIYVNGGVEFNRNLNRAPGGTEGGANIDISADGVTAWGWNVAMMFKPSENVTLGATYRSKIELDAEDGDVTFTNITFPETKFDATLPLPAELTFGFSVKATEKLLLAAEFNRAYWSAYESLSLDFSNPAVPDSNNTRNYKNSTTYRVGAQYNLSEKLDVRAGYYFDESPVQSGFFAPETPRNDGHGFTTGLSFNLSEKFAIDLSLSYLYFDEVDESYDSRTGDGVPPFRGTYKTNAFLGGLGITYKM